MSGRVGQIYFLNYDYNSHKGFFSKLIVKILHVDNNNDNAICSYELIDSERFDEQIKSSIDDAFYPTLSS